jgi:hypothetical protein
MRLEENPRQTQNKLEETVNLHTLMKKTLLLTICAVGLVVGEAFAQVTMTATTSPNVTALSTGDTFTVTFSLQNPPNFVSGFDLFLESNSANVNNGFEIISRTVGAGTDAGLPTYPDVISTSTSDHLGFAQNANDQGRFFSTDQAGASSLETLTLQVLTSTAGSYTFSTTSSSLPENKQTLVFGGPTTADDLNQFSVTPGDFTVTVVPEPSTWLAGIGAVGVIGYTMLRRRRTA